MRSGLSFEVFDSTTAHRDREPSGALPSESVRAGDRLWNKTSFANQQIHSLVRHVFFSNTSRPIRQVIFSAVDSGTDVRPICTNVGRTLAGETSQNVAVLPECPARRESQDESDAVIRARSIGIQRMATRVNGNLWLLSPAALDAGSTASLHSLLGELRREFEFSIVAAPAAGESQAAAAMAEFADGIILVLTAHRTRRAAAYNVKQALEAAGACVLGVVLAGREFPMPDRIYRRL